MNLFSADIIDRFVVLLYPLFRVAAMMMSAPLFSLEVANARIRIGLAMALVLLFATYTATVVPTMLLAGNISDRVGRKRVLIPAMLVLGAGSVVFAFTQSVPMLFVGRVFQGLAVGMFLGVGTAFVVDHAIPALVDSALQIAGNKSDNVTALAVEWEGAEDSDSKLGISTRNIGEDVFASTIQASMVGSSLLPDIDEDEIERSIEERLPAADVVVHVEPAGTEPERDAELL